MTRISPDLAARAAELLTVPMGWGSGPALNALAEKIGGRIADVAARNQTFREALEAVVRMGREPRQSTGNALAERLRRHVDGDHQRGCQGRQYSCSCGYDATTEELLALAASEIMRLTNEPQSVPATFNKIQHRGVFIERQLQAGGIYRFICHTGISKFLPDLYETQEQAISAVDAKLDAPALTRPHDRTGEA